MAAASVAAACGGTELTSANPVTDARSAVDGSTTDSGATACVPGRSLACVGSGGCGGNQVCNSAGTAYGPCDCSSGDSGSPPLCVPGQSIACAGAGGCSSNQVCNSAGTAYGPCDCTQPVEAGTSTPCVPGQSIACTAQGGCISSQVCNAAGTAYGPCVCSDDDGAVPVCIPGQSIACTGAGGCFANQVCNGNGTAYGPCACSDAGSVECETPADCQSLLGALPPLCDTCSNGQLGCAHYVCVSGVCQVTYCG